MSNLLLITDVSRLHTIFGLLVGDPSVRLRVAASLEKGSEEIMHDRPDIVFVQTHISGFSADILLKHLKKHARDTLPYFVLLAAPTQIGASPLQSFQGWLDTSVDDNRLLEDIKALVSSLVATSIVTEAPAGIELTSTAAPERGLYENHEKAVSNNGTPALGDSLEDQGLLYSPRPRLSVYSEFTASFDSAVRESSEQENLTDTIPTSLTIENNGSTDQFIPAARRSRTKPTSFLLWLILVVVAGIAFTFYQQSSPQQKKLEEKAPDPGKPKETSRTQTTSSSARVAAALLKPISSAAGSVHVPNFIPRAARDVSYTAANPGWERYATKEVEYRVYRVANTIKAVQIIALSGSTISTGFLQDILRQLTSNPSFVSTSSEKTDGYTIERGHLSDVIKAVYYRDGSGKNLKAVVLTWN